MKDKAYHANKKREEARVASDELKSDYIVNIRRLENELKDQCKINRDLENALSMQKEISAGIEADLLHRERELQSKRLEAIKDLQEKLDYEKDARMRVEEQLKQVTRKKDKEVKKLLKQRLRLLQEIQGVYRLALESELGAGKTDELLRDLFNAYN